MHQQQESSWTESGGGGGGSGGGGGTKMKVVRHVETTYVGGHPVNRSSNVEIRDAGGE